MTFVAVVDAPALALIVPVLSRGSADGAPTSEESREARGACARKLPTPRTCPRTRPILLPDIQKRWWMSDAEVRATAAAALASRAGMGGAEAEQSSERDPSWLTRTLQSASGTERSGRPRRVWRIAIAVLRAGAFEAMLPEIFAGCAHVAPHVREGTHAASVLTAALGAAFEAHLKEALSSVLAGLADAAEPVRHAALGVGPRPRGGRSRTAAPAWTCCCPRSRRRWATRTGASA